jgi:hypothetical protein
MYADGLERRSPGTPGAGWNDEGAPLSASITARRRAGAGGKFPVRTPKVILS